MFEYRTMCQFDHFEGHLYSLKLCYTHFTYSLHSFTTEKAIPDELDVHLVA